MKLRRTDGRMNGQNKSDSQRSNNESMFIGLFNNSFETIEKIVFIFVPKEQEVCLSVSLFNNFSDMTEPIEHIWKAKKITSTLVIK